MKNKTNILICGDICPTQDTHKFFEANDVDSLFNDTLPLLKNADILIGNLEFVLTDNCNKATKTGPILQGNNRYINIFKSLNFTALSLANNHIKDCGPDGVLDTLSICQKNNIKTVGAGKNEKQAKKPLIIEKNGWRIGIMAFAEHEFNAAYENEAGANLFDLYEDFDRIKELKKQVDYLIILNHGGIEYYKYPSPLLQKKCRKMIDSGADYVVNQHSHVIGTEEDYKHGKILYGQGNTLFGYRPFQPLWNQGLLIKISLSKDNVLVENIPIKTTEKGNINFMKEDEKERLLNKMENDKNLIINNEFVKKSWENFCNEKESLYLPLLLGKSRYFNILNRLTNNRLIKLLYSSKKLRIVKNLLRCESHLEVVNTILSEK